jgi:hypothetical protein
VIDDRLSRSAPTDQQTEVLPPADVPDGMPLPLAPKVIFLWSIRLCAAGDMILTDQKIVLFEEVEKLYKKTKA